MLYVWWSAEKPVQPKIPTSYKYFHQSQKCLNWPAGWKYLLKVEIVCPTAFLADYIVQKYSAQTYLQLPLRQWGAGNVYLLVLSTLLIIIVTL